MYKPISAVVESSRAWRGILDKLVMGSVTRNVLQRTSLRLGGTRLNRAVTNPLLSHSNRIRP